MDGRPLRVIGVEDRFDPVALADGIGDGVVNAFRRLIGDIAVFQHPAPGVAFADQIPFINPSPGNAFDLPEKMQLGFTILVAEISVEKMFGEVVGNGAGAFALGFGGGNHHAFADDAFHQHLPRADQLRR